VVWQSEQRWSQKKNRNGKARRNNYRKRTEMARARDEHGGLQNAEPSFKLNWNLSSMNRKPERPRKTGRTLFEGIWRTSDWAGMKRVNWHIPEAARVNVWPNVSSTRDELRSQVRFHHPLQGRIWGWLGWLVTPLARQLISCYYYACNLSYFDVVLCPSSSQFLATNAQISFSRKPRPPQCSLASLARVPKVTTL